MALTDPTRGLTPERIREVNVLYHDAAASGYDSKWGIDYGEIGAQQVITKLSKALGSRPGHYERALEIGAGTGYFSLNLVRTGIVDRITATDISPGMLDRLAGTAKSIGIEVETVAADAESLPFGDETFDLVLGHAVLHHLPAPAAALAEFWRVLTPGGTIAFMGEPSYHGHRLAAVPKRVGLLARPVWQRLVGVELASNGRTAESDRLEGQLESEGLEPLVDVHVFSPADLKALAEAAGFSEVHLAGEELLASVYGWLLRSLQADTDPVDVPRAWHQFAFRSYLALQWLDGRVLEPRLPPNLFYNLLLSGRKPA